LSQPMQTAGAKEGVSILIQPPSASIAKGGFFMKYLFGLFSAFVLGYVVGLLQMWHYLDPAPFKKLAQGLKVYTRKGWPMRDFWPPLAFVSEQPQGTSRPWPPPHPGGPKQSESDLNDYEEYFVRRGLTKLETAWQAYLADHPEACTNPITGKPLDEFTLKVNRNNWKQRMTRIKGKKKSS